MSDIELEIIKSSIRYIEYLQSQNNTPSIDIKLVTAKDALQKQLDNRWIPVSEKLPYNPSPEDGEPEAYLVTINKHAIVPTTLYYLGDGKWIREFDEPSQIYTNILAWKPLPEVYKE